MSLAQDATVEHASALLWRLPVEAALEAQLPESPVPTTSIPVPVRQPTGMGLLTRFATVTADEPTARSQTDPLRLAAGCWALTRAMLYCMLDAPIGDGLLHQELAAGWRLDPEEADLVRAALVLCADHELSASGFTARCIASTGASLRAAVIGALAAQSGPRHGGVSPQVEGLWQGLDGSDPVTTVRRRLAVQELLPGFGHRLYPGGDVRAAYLLQRIVPRLPQAGALTAAARTLADREPNLDFALVALRRCLTLPEGSAFKLFAIGRTLGWIGHALEQRESGRLIRPRAAHTGPEPR